MLTEMRTGTPRSCTSQTMARETPRPRPCSGPRILERPVGPPPLVRSMTYSGPNCFGPDRLSSRSAMPIRAVGGLGHSADEALQRHVERLLLAARRLGGEAQLLQRLDADPDLIGGLADGVRRPDRAINKRGEPADRRGPDQRTAERANAGAQQLRLAAEALQPRRRDRPRSRCASGSARRSGRPRPARP